MRLRNRTDAGRRLAERVRRLELHAPVVLALPRGGVPVAFEVAAALEAPLEVFVVRKIGAPGQRELGIGAIAEGGALLTDGATVRAVGVSERELDELAVTERREVERRVRDYRGERPLPELAGRDVVLVDDGLATGVTAEVALRALRGRAPRRLLLAVPVSAPDTARRLRGVADEVVCLLEPQRFRAVGLWYDDFAQTTDEEVLDLLHRAQLTGRR